MKTLFLVGDTVGGYEIFNSPAEGLAFTIRKCVEISKEAKLNAEETLEAIDEMCESFADSNGESFYSEDSFYGFPVNYHNREN